MSSTPPDAIRPDDAAVNGEATEVAVPLDCPWPIVLGVDPGTRVLGYGAIVRRTEGPRLLAAGTIEPTSTLSVPQRLATIRFEFERLLQRLRPTVVVIEKAFSARNVQSALRIGEGRGVVLAAAAGFGAEVVQYMPSTAKKALVGSGQGTKEQVAAMAARLLGLETVPGPLDVTDALGLALAFDQKDRGAGARLRTTVRGSNRPR
ncbi:MAG: crossover junction endodeoxyribonuclease RuvC [Planctomycetes bacterium]|nr:crossover junction endodeoxyribonuclease RuvC [Planctomycetota bacterium]MCB9904459.1 crossover junction endodeoxyribonuclease RuvC [Planctomycetota bacterium]